MLLQGTSTAVDCRLHSVLFFLEKLRCVKFHEFGTTVTLERNMSILPKISNHVSELSLDVPTHLVIGSLPFQQWNVHCTLMLAR